MKQRHEGKASPWRVWWSTLTATGILMTAFAVGVPGATGAVAAQGEEAADKFLIVDCLLPPKIRKLGRNKTFLGPRSATRTSARDCEIRGGEYVSYDRANYGTALKVWLEPAQQGDPKAQTYVGELFEQGVGGPPDYGSAAQWYQRASEQGYQAAMINLAALYEQGLGVPQDSQQAVALYRRAAGVEAVVLDAALNVPPVAAVNPNQAEIDALRAQVATLQQDLATAQQQQAEAASASNAQDAAHTQQLMAQMEAQRAEMAAERERLAAERQAYLQRQQSTTETTAQQQRELQTLAVELLQREQALQQREESIRSQEQQLQQRQQALSTEEASILELQREVEAKREQLAALEKERGMIAATPAAVITGRFSPSFVQQFGSYHALVIGNNQYQHLEDLDTAIRDATAVGKILKERYGFKVTMLTDASRYEILSALNKMRETLTDQDNFLLYYAGHGVLDDVNSRGHWLPVDAEDTSSANWISNVAITDILNAMSAKHVLVVADSCYSGALTRSALTRLQPGMSEDARNQWISEMLKKRSRTALTSGGLEPVLDSVGGPHSIFAQAFLNALATNEDVIEGQALYKRIAANVSNAAGSVGFSQLPDYAPIRFAGHEAGDFFFLPR